jgi:two-component system OmpR family response regulator
MAKILLVEDDISLKSAYTLILSSKKHEVKAAGNGQEALEALKNFTPRIILLDLLMPVMDGLEFLKKYQESKHPVTDILLLTNMPSSPDVDQTLKLGVKSVVVKSSMTPSNLLNLVDRLLAK